MRLIVIIVLNQFLIFGLFAQKGMAGKDSSCVYFIEHKPPVFLNIAPIDSVIKSVNEFDFIELYDRGNYSGNYNYIHLFKRKATWFFESSNEPERQVKLNLRAYLNRMADSNSYYSFVCRNPGQMKYYLIYREGVLVNSLISNVDLDVIDATSSMNNEVTLLKDMVRQVMEIQKIKRQ